MGALRVEGAALWVGVALVGGVGALLRWTVDGRVRQATGARAHGLPVGILVVNLTGSAALGGLSGAGVSGDAGLLAGVALVGAYTTYSTWVVDAVGLAASRRRGAAAANLLVSLGAGLACVWVGRLVGGWL